MEEVGDKLRTIELKTDDVVFRASSVFPFQLFPDEIVVDKNKVNIINRIFFGSEMVHSIAIDQISDVALETGPLFATLRFKNKTAPFEETSIQYLPKSQAQEMQRIVQGLMLASQEKIDTTYVRNDELKERAEESGKVVPSPQQ